MYKSGEIIKVYRCEYSIAYKLIAPMDNAICSSRSGDVKSVYDLIHVQLHRFLTNGVYSFPCNMRPISDSCDEVSRYLSPLYYDLCMKHGRFDAAKQVFHINEKDFYDYTNSLKVWNSAHPIDKVFGCKRVPVNPIITFLGDYIGSVTAPDLLLKFDSFFKYAIKYLRTHNVRNNEMSINKICINELISKLVAAGYYFNAFDDNDKFNYIKLSFVEPDESYINRFGDVAHVEFLDDSNLCLNKFISDIVRLAKFTDIKGLCVISDEQKVFAGNIRLAVYFEHNFISFLRGDVAELIAYRMRLKVTSKIKESDFMYLDRCTINEQDEGVSPVNEALLYEACDRLGLSEELIKFLCWYRLYHYKDNFSGKYRIID